MCTFLIWSVNIFTIFSSVINTFCKHIWKRNWDWASGNVVSSGTRYITNHLNLESLLFALNRLGFINSHSHVICSSPTSLLVFVFLSFFSIAHIEFKCAGQHYIFFLIFFYNSILKKEQFNRTVRNFGTDFRIHIFLIQWISQPFVWFAPSCHLWEILCYNVNWSTTQGHCWSVS